MLSEGSEGGGAIAEIEYLSLQEKHKPKLQWEKNSGEDFFLYIDDDPINHAVFSRRSSTRGAGISIWEASQGLDYFFDILNFSIQCNMTSYF